MQSWILSYFHQIHGYYVDPDYEDFMPRAARFILNRGNDNVVPYRVFLDRTNHEDLNWTLFEDYMEVVPFDTISLYSGWLACGANMMVRYLLERCMRQFGYEQSIPRFPFQVALDTITRRALDDVFQDWENHVMPDDFRLLRASHM